MIRINIVIPIYKCIPDAYELSSLKQCFQVLHNYNFTFTCSKQFDSKVYVELAKAYRIRYNVELFDDVYFKNLEGYNALLVSPEFYSRFLMYDYILIHQLDSFVFSDNLNEWCSGNYDYVGAPWIQTNWLRNKKKKLRKESLAPLSFFQSIITQIHWLFKGYYKENSLSVGNGGFSLRKINSFLRLCSEVEAAKSWADNEDVYWSVYIPLNFEFNIPEFKQAAEFSFDIHPQFLFILNKKKLPMGCHAWSRNDFPYENNFKFWEKIIDRYNG